MISRTFEIYRRSFVKFVIVFIIIEAVAGAATLLIERSVSVSSDVVGSTGTAVNTGVLLGEVFALVAATLVIGLILYPFEVGAAIKMTSDDIEKGQTDLTGSLRYMVGKLIPFWIVAIIVGIAIGIGLILLIVPGIILAIMFSLVTPVVVLEKAGIFGSMSRARTLVSHRWGKTFVYGILLLLITGIPVLVIDEVAHFGGLAGSFAGDVLSAFFFPIGIIGLTVYYFSNLARTAPPQQTPMGSTGWPVPAATKYCPSCGTQLAATATFCPSCGAKQEL